jgi:hypothetical protein
MVHLDGGWSRAQPYGGSRCGAIMCRRHRSVVTHPGDRDLEEDDHISGHSNNPSTGGGSRASEKLVPLMTSWQRGSGGGDDSLMTAIWDRKQLPYGLPPRWAAGWAVSWAMCLEHRSM